MSLSAPVGQSLPPGMVFKPTGRQLIMLYLGPTAGRGKLSNAILPGGCSVAAGVDVFTASPDALPFRASHRGEHGVVWGYFAAARAADGVEPAPGGCWARYGKEKPYVLKFETIAYRSRFAFHVTRVEGDGTVLWAPTRWMMKEYRLNKDAKIFRRKKLECPDANMDFVIRKVFTKPAVPLPPPAPSGKALQVPPVKASVVAARKDPGKTKTKTKTKAKKVAPPPLPPYARSEGGVALQQGGNSLPPRSARPPRPPFAKLVVPAPPRQVLATPVSLPPPPKAIATPVAPPPAPKAIPTSVAPPLPAQAIAKPVAPPLPPKIVAKPVVTAPPRQVVAKPVFTAPPRQFLATPVAPPRQPKVIATPVAPPRQPKVIAKPVAPPRQPKVIAKPVAPPPSPQVIATPVVPPPRPQVIAAPVVSAPPPARSSQGGAALNRLQPDNPNANKELVVCRVPAKPLLLHPPRAPPHIKIPSGFGVVALYLVPKAVRCELAGGVNPRLVAEGVDVFAVSPDALPFPPRHRKQNGEVWGYFFAAKPTTSLRLAHGGCWMRYGGEKKYNIPNGEVIAYRSRFAFHAARMDGDGVLAWEQTPWLMKEYRTNKATPFLRNSPVTCPGANLDLVVLKVFRKPVVPPPPPACTSGEAENPGSNNPSVNEGAGPVVHPPPPLAGPV